MLIHNTIFYLLLVISLSLITDTWSTIFFTGCDKNCICDQIGSNLTVKCYMEFSTSFQLPVLHSLNHNTTKILINKSWLPNYPENVCLYTSTLLNLDLSDNLISTFLNSTHFECLTSLEYLNLSKNSISLIHENSFNSLNTLKELDLSNNRIENIPTNLFYFKLPNLTYLNLKNNYIKELDVWMLFLKSIKHIDLSFNQINKFVNRIEWNPFYVSPYIGLTNADLIDLRFNKLTSFDDSLLKLFSVCTSNEFILFLNIFNKILLDFNDFNCTCRNSYNLLQFFQSYITRHTITSTNYIFFLKCSAPSDFSDKNLFSFTDPNICGNVSENFSEGTCGYKTTTFSSLKIPQKLKNEPELNMTEITVNYFNDAQIAGCALGLLGIFLLIFLLIYCLCQIELLALCFDCIPFFYSVCPCKSRVKQEKEFDLFISYNKSSENWLRNKLIPFIKENCLIQNYILHYNEENRLDEVFGNYIKDVMNKSSCILFILSDDFLMKEWNNQEYREHLRYLISRERTRFLVIQMHDISDEEVEEYFVEKLQIPRFVSLENDEWLFWKKLAYFLYTNNAEDYNIKFNKKNKIQDENFSSALFSKFATPDSFYTSSTGFEVPSVSKLNEDSGIYHSSTRLFPKKKDSQKMNMRKKIIMNRTSQNILFSTERRPINTEKLKISHEISDDSFNFVRTNDASLKVCRNSVSSSTYKPSEREFMNNLIYQQRIASNKNTRYPSIKKNIDPSPTNLDNQ